jgi:hypothetical protein
MGPFGQVYALLVERGYSVLPIMPGTKKPGLPRGSNGKWMDFPGWTTFQACAVHYMLWATAGAGIGVLCGPRGGYLIVIDIDTDDPEILAALRSVLPDTPVKKKGARGESWFYYGPDISSRSWLINGRKVVEVIGPGRQTVLPPTIHPDLGEPYRWIGSKTLEEVRPENLPLLSIENIERIDAVLASFGYVPPEPRERTSCDECDAADDPHRRLNEAALDNLAAWVPALDLYRCRPYRQGFEAVATWRPSTMGRKNSERDRNLKIAPNGIRDFGVDQGYTAIDLVMAARECDLDAAFIFLSEHLEWASGEPLLDISTLAVSAPKLETLGLAELDDDGSNGNSNGSSNESSKGNGADHTGVSGGAHTTGAHIGAHNGGASSDAQVSAQVIPLFKPALGNGSGTGPSTASGEDAPAADDPGLDLEPLTYVPGLVGNIVDWIVGGARRRNRVLALAAAITVVGTLIGRRAMGPTGNATHLYPMIIAPVSGGKEWPCNAIQILIEAAGAGALLHPGEIASQGGLDDTLLTMPVGAIIIDEIHNFLGRLVSLINFLHILMRPPQSTILGGPKPPKSYNIQTTSYAWAR